MAPTIRWMQLYRVKSMWKACRVLALVALYTFLLLHISLSSLLYNEEGRRSHLKSRPITWLTPQHVAILSPNDSRLIDRHDFRYLLQPNRTSPNSTEKTFFVIYVHSAPAHFSRRRSIRSTWGSVRRIGVWFVRLIFLVGMTTDQLQSELLSENQRHGDLLQGNFVDSYRNLSYKHLMGYKWILSDCPFAQFVVKADDDVYVDVVQLFQLLREMYTDRSPSSAVLACSVWEEGSVPQRSLRHKWAVSRDEYSYDAYPAYCAGLAYVVSPAAAKDLLAASQYVPMFWIDDLYVTGLLVETVPWLRHHALNLRTTYDSRDLVRWLRERSSPFKPSPYVFGDVSQIINQSSLLHKLWEKTISVWKQMDVVYKVR